LIMSLFPVAILVTCSFVLSIALWRLVYLFYFSFILNY
jgi:hypothetical protein